MEVKKMYTKKFVLFLIEISRLADVTFILKALRMRSTRGSTYGFHSKLACPSSRELGCAALLMLPESNGHYWRNLCIR